jgi:hypothetical protein
MTTFSVTYDEFYKQSGEFFKMAKEPATTYEQVQNGVKALTLMYFGINHDLTEHQQVSAEAIVRLATKKEMEFDPVMQRGAEAMQRLREFVNSM